MRREFQRNKSVEYQKSLDRLLYHLRANGTAQITHVTFTPIEEGETILGGGDGVRV